VKTTVTAVVATVVALLLGIGFRYTFKVANGGDFETNVVEDLQLNMSHARDLFLEHNETFQTIAMYLYDKPGTRFMRDFSSEDFADYDPGDITDEPEFQIALNKAFAAGDDSARLFNIAATTRGVYFYTNYSRTCVVGFVHENVIGNTEDYETLEINENWKLFFRTFE
jgi:hypothetical protein